MAKKIAVIVRGRQGEALRMSIGLIVLDDEVEVFITESLSEETKTFLENDVADLVSNVYSTVSIPGLDVEQISVEEMADKLLEYDNILSY